MGRRSRSRWSITGRGSPSARGYLGTVRRWWSSWSAWLLGELEGDDIPRIDASRAPVLPADSIRKAGAPVATAAGTHARRVLRGVGMPSMVERSILGIVTEVGLDATIEGASLAAWAQDGVGLIRAVPADLLDELPGQIAEIVSTGGRWEQLREQVRERLGVGERHLELIARDQVAKLNSRVTEDMHRAAGIEEYTWRANLDERTRPSHAAAHGTVVRWDSEGVPGTGFYGEASHAGRGGQCRCTAEPVPPPGWFG